MSNEKSNTAPRPVTFNVKRHTAKIDAQKLDKNAIRRFIIGLALK